MALGCIGGHEGLAPSNGPCDQKPPTGRRPHHQPSSALQAPHAQSLFQEGGTALPSGACCPVEPFEQFDYGVFLTIMIITTHETLVANGEFFLIFNPGQGIGAGGWAGRRGVDGAATVYGCCGPQPRSHCDNLKCPEQDKNARERIYRVWTVQGGGSWDPLSSSELRQGGGGPKLDCLPSMGFGSFLGQ